MKKTNPRAQQEASPAVTFFILLVSTVVVVAIGSLVLLDGNQWVQLQRFWLISRAAAVAAYIVLTVLLVLGIVISHPRNKDTWRLTPRLLPWHQAMVGVLFSLVTVHLIFSLVDSKSGVSLQTFWNPMNSKYHPLATLFGVIGFYLLLLVGITAGLRKWVKIWLPVHRVSWVLWIFLSLHGFYDGTDSIALRPLYEISLALVLLTFFWRHWTNDQKRLRRTGEKGELKGGESVELQS